jgi:hypothetical protein
VIPLDEKIFRAKKMLRELDPAVVEDAILEMRFLPDGAAAIQATLEKHDTSKPVKNALKRYRHALENVLDARKELIRVRGLGLPFSLALAEKDDFAGVLDKELAGIEGRLAIRRAPSRFDPYARVAVKTARILLLRAGCRLVVKRRSEWCRLAAILYGEPSKDMYHYVAEFRAGPKPESN